MSKAEPPHPAGVRTIPFPDEIIHLDEIQRRLDAALQSAEVRLNRLDGEYSDMQRYMMEYRGELDPHEMLQNDLGLRRLDSSAAFAAEVKARVSKLRDSPYFARVDFRDTATGEVRQIYIGRYSFFHDSQALISDWRSPIAGLFYDYELGPATYVAPRGDVVGELTRKRQFRIKDGVLEYALESSATVHDDILQRELSRSANDKMKSIIATIQREQNQVIRSTAPGTLIIQGVAGSGKTSVALHRIAFLLYRFSDRLTADQVTILSPNRVFGDFVSGVLPELGEEPIRETSADDIAVTQLRGIIGFEPDRDPLEVSDSGWIKRSRFKSTLAFLQLLDDFAREVPAIAFAASDFTHGGFTVSAEQIDTLYRERARHPVKRRLRLVADVIHERLKSSHSFQTPPGRATIVRGLQQMLRVTNTLELYQIFYRRNRMTEMFCVPKRRTLEWADVYPFLYLQAVFEGLVDSGEVRHLVIDEMQDYTPVQHAVFGLLFPCDRTILGDFGQRLHPYQVHSLDDIRQVYSGAGFVELAKSYRSTLEITSFAAKILNDQPIDAVERHGDPPTVVACDNHDFETAYLVERIRGFTDSEHSSLAIIVKTDDDVRCWYDALPADLNVHRIEPDTIRYPDGVSILSVRMAKGLEFDEVMIPDADRQTYRTDYDRRLLYVACTRAMHRLTLLHTGAPTALIS